MSALLILNYDVHDQTVLERYRTAAAPVLIGDGAGELIVSTDQTMGLAEHPHAGTHTVVLRFSSTSAALTTYTSRAYQPMLEERLRAVTPRFAAIVPLPS
jgi:uncharacterized protein (DUF1330 family)